MAKWIKRFIWGFLSVVAIGIIIERLIQVHLNLYKPDGKDFYDTGTYPLHFVKKGKGGPTVVFQSGLGGDHKIWDVIQDSLSRYTTTISYDREGVLWSGSGNAKESKTLEGIADELSALLEGTNCPKPYLLVGHSLAGITLRPLVRDHKEDIAGIVFIDVSHPLQLEKSSAGLKQAVAVPPKWMVSALVETGIFRLFYSIRPFVAELPKDHWFNEHTGDYFYRSYATVLKEAKEDDQMFLEAQKMDSFGEIPLTVITAVYPPGTEVFRETSLMEEYRSVHMEGQRDLLNLSSNSTQIMAKKSGHMVPLQEPELIIGTLKKMLYLKDR